MTSFAVFTPPPERANESAHFVRDGFSPLALIVPPLWLGWHGLWLELAGWLGLAVLIAGLQVTGGWAVALAPLLSLVGVYLAVDGAALRMAALKRRGFALAGIVDAEATDIAELRFTSQTIAKANELALKPVTTADANWRPQVIAPSMIGFSG
jgi:hypothetical protein